jgi:hypothetical protein
MNWTVFLWQNPPHARYPNPARPQISISEKIDVSPVDSIVGM